MPLALPRIDHDDPGAFEIRDVAGDDRHAMDKGGSGDQGIGLVAPVGYMEVGAAGGDRIIDGQDSAGEFGTDVVVEPGAEAGTLASDRGAECRARRVPVRGW